MRAKASRLYLQLQLRIHKHSITFITQAPDTLQSDWSRPTACFTGKAGTTQAQLKHVNKINSVTSITITRIYRIRWYTSNVYSALMITQIGEHHIADTWVTKVSEYVQSCFLSVLGS